MKPLLKKILRGGVVLIMAFGIAACAATPTPLVYHDDREEKPGPGLFSGQDGGFLITGEPEAKTADTENASSDTP
jgi:hypothetical protein